MKDVQNIEYYQF